jgi:hypothetical protein
VQLFPEVIDASQLQPRAAATVYLPVGVEGMSAEAGEAEEKQPYVISRLDEAQTLFGSTSSLYTIIKCVLDRGAGPVLAIASAVSDDTLPDLTDRQAAWEFLESDQTVRIRLTDSIVQADLVALAVSAKNANTIYNKQIALCGMDAATTKANLLSAATAIGADVEGAKRIALIAPGVFDETGVLRDGSYAAACVAAEIAKNSDPGNDLDLLPLPFLTGIATDVNGLPVFRKKVSSGVAVNDFEDLLQGGVSPLMASKSGAGVEITHLRTAYTADGTFDSLYTRIIIDQVFLDVKTYIEDNNFLRAGNTDATRARIGSGVEAVLNERREWISPVTQPDGTTGYKVSVTSDQTQRQVTVGYEGVIVRGISTVRVAPSFTISV